MPHLKIPLLSFDAHGSLSKAISFVKRRGQNIAGKKPKIIDARTPAQLSWRHMYQKCAALWHTLSENERAEWESLGSIKHMTGFAYWQSQCLKPNPGIYLPLQGGMMQGNIDMDKNRLLKLPLPTDDQEAATKKYHDDNLPAGGYTEGARVYDNRNQSIADITNVVLAFSLERYDTDNIHDNIINNSRLTCKTAGKYIIIGHLSFAQNATGARQVIIRLNGVTLIAVTTYNASTNTNTNMSTDTIYQLAVDDYVELIAYQTSGAPLDVQAYGNFSPEFEMQRIG